MRNKRKNTTKKLTLCAIISALGVVLLLVGSIIDVLELSAVMIASFCIVLTVIEAGGSWPWLTYAVITVLSLLLFPNKFTGLLFLFAGYYPVIKSYIEKLRRKVIGWGLKLLFFWVSLAALFTVCALFLPSVDLTLWDGLGKTITYVIYYLIGTLIFILYDVLLTRLISLYVYKLRAGFHVGQ